MLNPNVVVDAQIDALRSIPGLVAALAGGHELSISAYAGYSVRDIEEAISQMHSRTIMVVYDGTGFSEFGEVMRLFHDFRIIIKTDRMDDTDGQTGYLTVLSNIINGVPENDNLAEDTFMNMKLLPDLEPINEWDFRPSTDTDSVEFWQLSYKICEIGG